ncbi:hypothetical protein LTR95_019600 [Oleoguttula sp. CCFEE 5521]
MPVTLGVKIRKKEEVGGGAGRKKVALGFRMRVWDVGEVVREKIVKTFEEVVGGSEVRYLRRLLVPILRERLLRNLAIELMETAVLGGAISIPGYEAVAWEDSLRCLEPERRGTVRQFLQAWHKEHTTITIDLDDESNAKDYVREVNLPVEVPTLDVVFNASIAIAPKSDTKSINGTIAKLGDPVTIDYTRRWSAANTSAKPTSSKTRPESFIVEMQANEDVWLVGGVKRKRITLPAPSTQGEGDDDGEGLAFPLVLIPLKLGSHRLPTVEIAPAPVEGETQRSSTTCETHCSSAGRLITVVKGQQRSRVRIVEDEADGEG